MNISDNINELVIEGTRIGIWDWNIQTGETFFNERWAEILGYSLTELQPVSIQTWISLAHPDDLQESNRLIKEHIEGRSAYYEFKSRMKHKDGHWAWVHDRGKVFEWDQKGRALRMCGSHIDITEEMNHQIDLKRAHREKKILLSEVHHRVKNNLQLIQSLTRLKKKEDKITLSEINDIIRTIALAHEALYKTDRFDKIDLYKYLDRILHSILTHQNIEFKIRSEGISEEIDVLIPIGLILTECVNNSIKHGFTESINEKKIEVSIAENNGMIQIVYKDNGIGYQAPIVKSTNKLDTFGITIMKALAGSINGEIRFSNDNGAKMHLTLDNNNAFGGKNV